MVTQLSQRRERDWMAASLTDIADHIERTHHVYMRMEMPRIMDLLKRAVAAEGARRPSLVELRDLFARFMDELLEHMDKEERNVFPVCRQLDHGVLPRDVDTGLRAPMDVMMTEHSDGADEMLRIRELTDDFIPPDDASDLIYELYARLRHLAQDLHEHVSKENCVLALKARQIEQRLQQHGRT